MLIIIIKGINMARPRFRRRIGWLPERSYFRPEGNEPFKLMEITLTLDEVEALRLADLMGLYQEEAAKRMNISRPTFGRILEVAHRKVADAIINGKAIKIMGGTVEFEVSNMEFGPGGFCVCPKCGFKKPHEAGVPCRDERCPQCGAVMMRESYFRDLNKDRKKGGE